MATACPDYNLVQRAKRFACELLHIDRLKPEQSKALDACIQGFDTFISLPTGFGKSLVYQCTPFCHDYLYKHWSKSDTEDKPINKALAIVVVPLKSLATDQVKRASELGIEAESMISDITDELIDSVCCGKYSLLFSSPEILLSTKGKELLQNRIVYDRVCNLFIDESHCVVKWGHSSAQTTAFRKCYGMLGELRSILKLSTPVIAMTATATNQVRVGLLKSLGMHNVVLIHSTPSVHNIKHVVVQTKLKDPSEVFHWLCESLLKEQRSAERVIIFCQSRRHCSELYSAFSSYLPQSFHKYFNMFHTNTENDIQEEIAKDFSIADGQIRVLFATIAFGLGIDVKGVHNVIMYGCPSDIDDYVQLSGRGGRDGKQSLSIIIDIPIKTGSGISAEMKEFVNTKECRRELLKKAFPASSETIITPHDCCDNCSSNCLCLGQVCNKKMMAVEKEIQSFQSTFDNEIAIRVVSDEDYESVKQALYDMHVDPLTSEQTYAGPELAMGLTKSTVHRLLSNLHLAFTYTEFVSHFHFPDTEVADQVWALIQRHVGSNAVQKKSQVSNLESEDKDDIEIEEEQLLLESEYAEAYLEGSDSD